MNCDTSTEEVQEILDSHLKGIMSESLYTKYKAGNLYTKVSKDFKKEGTSYGWTSSIFRKFSRF